MRRMTDGDGNGGAIRLRVSDAVAVPLRGMLLRLRVLEGRPRIKQFGRGSRLRLQAPHGPERTVEIIDLGVTGGRQTQQRLETVGEVDLMISTDDALRDGDPVEIGWTATPA
ncbi:MAG: hypothetical protein ACRELD_14715 [Longimicrobiales bacterium]